MVVLPQTSENTATSICTRSMWAISLPGPDQFGVLRRTPRISADPQPVQRNESRVTMPPAVSLKRLATNEPTIRGFKSTTSAVATTSMTAQTAMARDFPRRLPRAVVAGVFDRGVIGGACAGIGLGWAMVILSA